MADQRKETVARFDDQPAAPGVGMAATVAAAGMGETVAVAPGGAPSQASAAAGAPTFAAARTTVVPAAGTSGAGVLPGEGPRYEAKGLLGRGAMGEVMLAYDRDIGRPVAVKRLHQEHPGLLARFADEIRTLGRLEHPNITPIHDVDIDDDGRLYFTMRYIEGESLADVIRKLADGDEEMHRRYPLSRRLDCFAGIVRALQHAHEAGLLHRDVKPENIMIGPGGEVVLTDWGISKPIGSGEVVSTEEGQEAPAGPARATAARASYTMAGAVVGTPMYMCPEQAEGKVHELDARSDLYSAFLVLFELLTLRPYVDGGGSLAEVIATVGAQQPPDLNDPRYVPPHGTTVGSEYRHYLRQGLAHDPSERFPDAETVLGELDLIRSGHCRVSCPITFVKSAQNGMGRAIDRRPTLILGAMVLGVLTSLAAIAFSIYTLAS